MSKKAVYFIVLLAIGTSLLLNALFGRFLAVKISTWPLLNRWKIISPQAPIVINTREEVRVSDTGDVQQAINSARPKISLVISGVSGQATVLGGAINLTSDGYFTTSKSVTDGQKAQNLFVKLDDGNSGQVTSVTLDSPTGLVILKTNLTGVPVANLADSKSLLAGERLVFLAPTLENFSPVFQASFVSRSQQTGLEIKDADAPSRTFVVQAVPNTQPGQAVVDSSGDIAGLWDGDSVISSDVIKNLSAIFLGNQGNITRPVYGFRYRVLSAVEAKILGVSPGIKIVSVSASGPANKAGLLADDIIQSWDGTDLGGGAVLEELLQKYKPGDNIQLKALRGKNQLILTLTAGLTK
jgi:S1-C subfamily serine protease